MLDGIERRLLEIPVPAGNCGDLATDGKRLYLTSRDAGSDSKTNLRTFAIDNKSPELETYLADIKRYELSADGKKVLVQKGSDIYVIDAGAKALTELAKSQVSLKGWVLHFDPREEWRQMFADAWRLERDYFYDRGMNGIDWAAERAQVRSARRARHRPRRAGVIFSPRWSASFRRCTSSLMEVTSAPAPTRCCPRRWERCWLAMNHAEDTASITFIRGDPDAPGGEESHRSPATAWTSAMAM